MKGKEHSLYRELKPKLLAMGEDLDALHLKMVNTVDVSVIANTYGEHGIFFCPKSLDLDIKMGYPLGTDFSYQSVFR